MYKIFLAFLVILILYSEFKFLISTDVDKKSNLKIHISKASFNKDTNKSTTLFFDPKIWILTPKDKLDYKEEKQNIHIADNNNTLQIISQKGSRKLCKGNQCLIIRGILKNTLIVQKDKNITTLKSSEKVFNIITFKGIKNTTLYFKNDETNETYKLKFFSYKCQYDLNSSKPKLQKDKK